MYFVTFHQDPKGTDLEELTDPSWATCNLSPENLRLAGRESSHFLMLAGLRLCQLTHFHREEKSWAIEADRMRQMQRGKKENSGKRD